MYIKKLSIKNFRNIKNLNLELDKGLNIIIGENNTGKTAIIDALRICFSWGQQWKDIFLSKTDFFIDRASYEEDINPIEFDLFFEIENISEGGLFHELISINGNNKELQLHFRFFLQNKSGREIVRPKVWGGDKEGQTVRSEIFDLLYHVYLGALRNATQDLQPRRGNKIGQLLSNIYSDKDKQKNLADKIHAKIKEDLELKSLVETAQEKLNNHLRSTSIDKKELEVNLSFLPLEFRKIAEGLRVQTPIYISIPEGEQQEYFEIHQNGLGDNNRIYIATVLGDLLERKTIEPEICELLLIEEPEAHLHPQLQNILFSYFTLLKNNLQTIITSHSPTITAKANLDSIIVL